MPPRFHMKSQVTVEQRMMTKRVATSRYIQVLLHCCVAVPWGKGCYLVFVV
jgi:hypothetical protein